MFSDFWGSLAAGSIDLIPFTTGSDAIDGLIRLPSYILQTLQGGAVIFGS